MEVFRLLAVLGAAAAHFTPSRARLLDFEAVQQREAYDRNLHLYRYRPHYHITSNVGWLNNPAGFTMFRDVYHIFYQYHPYNGGWGYINWGHIVSENLIDWIHYPPALLPQEFYERHGCLAGTALIHNGYLTLFYTGHVIAKNKTEQNLNIALSSDGITFRKYLYNPLIKSSPNPNGEFRNPRVWQNGDSWYMLVGAMSKENHGQLLLYTSTDMFRWLYHGVVAESYGDMGYLFENPEFFELDGEDVVIFCARGVQTDRYLFRNLYQAGYLIGNFNYETGRFDEYFEVSTATFNVLDYGHDFYAPQTMLDGSGRRLLVGWLGMWGSNVEESKEGWASMLTLIREIKLNPNGRLMMTPIREMIELRNEQLEDAWYSPGEAFYAQSKAFEMLVNTNSGANVVTIIFEWGGVHNFVIEYHAKKGYVSVNKGGDDGERRADWAPTGDRVYWRIFVDFSSVELFCGRGEVVFSSRIYPRREITIRVEGDTAVHVVQYQLRRSINNNKKRHSSKQKASNINNSKWKRMTHKSNDSYFDSQRINEPSRF